MVELKIRTCRKCLQQNRGGFSPPLQVTSVKSRIPVAHQQGFTAVVKQNQNMMLFSSDQSTTRWNSLHLCNVFGVSGGVLITPPTYLHHALQASSGNAGYWWLTTGDLSSCVIRIALVVIFDEPRFPVVGEIGMVRAFAPDPTLRIGPVHGPHARFFRIIDHLFQWRLAISCPFPIHDGGALLAFCQPRIKNSLAQISMRTLRCGWW